MAREAGKRKARKPLQTLRKWRAATVYLARIVSGVRIACSAYTSPRGWREPGRSGASRLQARPGRHSRPCGALAGHRYQQQN